MRFSDRVGATKAKEVFQTNSMDANLRNTLYNIFYAKAESIWDHSRERGYMLAQMVDYGFFKKPIDETKDYFEYYSAEMKKFFQTAEWFDVYNFIEYLLDTSTFDLDIDLIKNALQSEMSGYQVLENGSIVPFVGDAEIESLNESLLLADPYVAARQHIEIAIDKLSQKPNPDPRNAIKEAICAVESAASVITGKNKPELKDALNIMEASGSLHGSLKEAWKKMYGYASDEQGIRHAALDDEGKVDFATAKYMVVVCSAFVNLLSTYSPYQEK